MLSRRRRTGAVLGLALPLVLLALAAGCRSGENPPRRPLLVLAVDGLEWDVLLPLLAAGELPTLGRWIDEGRSGLLETLEPTRSPVIWTTVATGKGWREHGISHFVRKGADGAPRLLTNSDRRAAALWNMASHQGSRSAVIGWWMTYPVEPIEGIMLAQANTGFRPGGRLGVWKGSVSPGRPDQVHPRELAPRVEVWMQEAERRLAPRLAALTEPFPEPMPRVERRLWRASLWSLRADAVYLRAAEALLSEEDDLDLMMLYLGGADVIGHRFWRYWRPEEFDPAPGPEQRAAFGDVVPAYYRHLDRALGSLTSGLDGWNVLLLSDHGMTAYRTDAPLRDGGGRGLSGHHRHAPPGVLVAFGPDIERAGDGPFRSREQIPVLGSVLDIAPTALVLLDLPLAEDLRGRPLEGLFTAERRDKARPEPVASYDRWFHPVGLAGEGEDGEEERLEQLRSLGYLDGG